MIPGNYDLAIVRGASLRRRIVWTRDGAVVDLSDYEAELQMRSYPDGPILFGLNSMWGGLSVDSGGITLDLSPAMTLFLEFRRARWSLKLTAPDRSVTQLLSGYARIYQEVAG